MSDDKIAEIQWRHQSDCRDDQLNYPVSWESRCLDTHEDRGILLAEVERLRADAIRYRWLKSRNKVSLLSDGTQWVRPDGSTFVASHSLSSDGTRWGVYETLDETIDRAMDDGR